MSPPRETRPPRLEHPDTLSRTADQLHHAAQAARPAADAVSRFRQRPAEHVHDWQPYADTTEHERCATVGCGEERRTP